MRRKCLILSVIGFLAGMIIGNLITWMASGTLVNTKLTALLGSEAGSVIVQTLLSGLFGAVAMGGIVIHEIEQWSILRCAVTHYLLIEIFYVPVALFLGWFGSLTELLIMIGIQLAVYFVIWLIMYLRCRAKVRKLNELLKESRK